MHECASHDYIALTLDLLNIFTLVIYRSESILKFALCNILDIVARIYHLHYNNYSLLRYDI